MNPLQRHLLTGAEVMFRREACVCLYRIPYSFLASLFSILSI
jgi:hypothetical protein